MTLFSRHSSLHQQCPGWEFNKEDRYADTGAGAVGSQVWWRHTAQTTTAHTQTWSSNEPWWGNQCQEKSSSPPSTAYICAAYMRQWTRSALVQIMACRLFGVKPLPEPTLTYCQLNPWGQTSVKFESKYKNIVCEMEAILSSGRWVKSCNALYLIGPKRRKTCIGVL